MKTGIANSRPHKKYASTWRRRNCTKCNQAFTTYERPASDCLLIYRADKATSEPFNPGKLIQSIARAAQHDQHQAKYDSYFLALTVESHLFRKSETVKDKKNNPTKKVSINEITDATYKTLKKYDELTGMQYAMQHNLITSVRRRGRPSTIATNVASGAERD